MSREKDIEFSRLTEKLRKNARNLSNLTNQMSNEVKKIKPPVSTIVKFKGKYDIKHTEKSIQTQVRVLTDNFVSAENFTTNIEHMAYQIL